jgi:hypothetical protein
MMQTAHAPVDVVVSYSRTDSDFVDRLEADLNAHQVTTWVDRRKLEGGQAWNAEIRSAIDQCRILLVLISPDALGSPWVRQEYRYALKQHKEVIPVRYHPTAGLPAELQKLQWIDFLLTMNFEATYPAHLQDLLKAIEFHFERYNAGEAARTETREQRARGTRRRLAAGLVISVLVLVLVGGVSARLFFSQQIVSLVPVLQDVPGFARAPTPSAPSSIVLDFDAYTNTLLAVADRPVNNTGYVIQLVDLTDGQKVVKQCATGSTCSLQIACPPSGSSIQYEAVVVKGSNVVDEAYDLSFPITIVGDNVGASGTCHTG